MNFSDLSIQSYPMWNILLLYIAYYYCYNFYHELLTPDTPSYLADPLQLKYFSEGNMPGSFANPANPIGDVNTLSQSLKSSFGNISLSVIYTNVGPIVITDKNKSIYRSFVLDLVALRVA